AHAALPHEEGVAKASLLEGGAGEAQLRAESFWRVGHRLWGSVFQGPMVAFGGRYMIAERQAQPKDRYLGREILEGQFRIIKKIGTGGMGSVYKAEQPDMNRMVAVKILHAK